MICQVLPLLTDQHPKRSHKRETGMKVRNIYFSSRNHGFRSHQPVAELSFAGKKQKGGSSGSGSGLLMPLQLSNDLVKFIGTGESMLSRSDVVKRMWEYIKENNLQVNFIPWILRCCMHYHCRIAWSFRYWLMWFSWFVTLRACTTPFNEPSMSG